MWTFRKKEAQDMNMQVPKPKNSDEIELIPEELPELETKQNSFVEPAEGALFPEIPEERVLKTSKPLAIKKGPIEKFIKTETHNNIFSQISEIMTDFDNMDFEISRVIDIKDQRNTKIDNLQDSLEDVSKKLMSIDNTLFGG
jgi:hypothetical protein